MMRWFARRQMPMLVLVGMVLGCLGADPAMAGDAKAAEGPAQLVKVIQVQAESVPLTLTLPGRSRPSLIAELRPQVNGIVQQRLFEEGSEVSAGQVLYQIDPALYEAGLAAAQADLARAEANRHAARLKSDRLTQLMGQSVASQQEHDEAEAELKKADAEVAAAQAALSRARIDLDYTRVKSPISGRIGRSSVTVGALVTANQQQALATVQQLDPVFVDLTQSNTEVSRMRRELKLGPLHKENRSVPVRLLLEDGVAYAHEGRLAFSEVTVDEDTGSITLRARFDNPEGELLPGMYLRAQMTLGEREGMMRVPHKAVTRDSRGRPQVMRVNAENRVEVQPITTVQSLGEHWVVSEGLDPGDRIIVEGLQRVRAGAEVRVEEAEKATSQPPEGT